jgi:chemotaxis signal transduction protein
MRTVVAFRAGGGEYAVAIGQVRRVLAATELAPLPDPLPGVAGLLRHDGATMTVIAPLAGGDHGGAAGQVLVLDHGGGTVGLLVEEVTGIRQVEEGDIGPSPGGQRARLVSGVLAPGAGGGVLLLVDPAALVEAAR